jgi:hypothetical protein
MEAGIADAEGLDSEWDQGSVTPKCASVPTMLVGSLDCPPEGGPIGLASDVDLAVNASDVFFTTGGYSGTIWRVPIRGGKPPVLFAPYAGRESALLATSSCVIVAQQEPSGTSPGEILRIPLDGTRTTVLATFSVEVIGTPVTDGQTLYFADTEGVKSVPLGGGVTRTLSAVSGSLALSGTNLIIASNPDVFSLPAAGGPLTKLAHIASGSPQFPMTCGEDLCWMNYFPSVVSCVFGPCGRGVLVRLGQGGLPTTISQDLPPESRLVFAGGDFFAIEASTASVPALMRIAEGGAPVLVGAAASLAVDESCLYTAGLTGVYSVEKSYRGQWP